SYEYSYTPVEVQGLSAAATRPGGSVVSSCALLAGGRVECWGAGEDGELGDGTTKASLTPVAVSGISTATDITGGEYTGCAVLSGGGIECWGAGGSGQLGDGRNENSLVPVPVSGIG
ncbi:MAG: RCC1 domain-containing protein, partial [Acidimicrobiales bacterium]